MSGLNAALAEDPVYQSSEAIFKSQRFTLARETYAVDEVLLSAQLFIIQVRLPFWRSPPQSRYYWFVSIAILCVVGPLRFQQAPSTPVKIR